MSTAILLAFCFLSNLGSNVFLKISSNTTAKSGKAGYALFLAINCLVACLFFLIISGFSVRLNIPTLCYSVAFAAVVLASLILGLYVYRFVKIATVTVVGNAGSLIVGALIGCCLFHEKLLSRDIFRIILMLAAVLLLSFGHRSSGPKSDKIIHGGITGVILLVLRVIEGAVAVIIQKKFALDPLVTDNNSFFFFTNVVLLLVVLVWIAGICLRNRAGILQIRKSLRPFPFAYIANTLCSNIGSLITILLLKIMAVSLYTPITTALGILSGVAGSAVFREKMDKWTLLAALLSVVAVII